MGPGSGEIGDGDGHFQRIERFESMVTYSEGGAAAGWNREVIAVLRIGPRRSVASLPAIENPASPTLVFEMGYGCFLRGY